MKDIPNVLNLFHVSNLRSSAVHNRIYNETDTEYSTIAEVSMETVTAEIPMTEKKLPLTLAVANDNSPSESEMYYTLEKGTHQHKAVQYDIKDTIESVDSTIIMAPAHQNTENDGYFTLERQNVVQKCCPYCSGSLSTNDINQKLHTTAESTQAFQKETVISAQFVKSENGLYASVTGCDEIYDHLSRNTGNISSEPKKD
ncbi:hypothetical protein FSP39_002333 [Pinctada imbricata]|uniref:Uncharacterized protein n=1 Tax=Pinctada imbricata TaxID=66713 RepID=A0AA88XQ08_PINIB|nr:hypothetical protein FSP39_002333 [Pinctada imbricata]